MKNWKRLLSALVAVFMLLTMPIMTGVSRAIAEDTVPEDGTLTIGKTVVNGDEEQEFSFALVITMYPSEEWNTSTLSYLAMFKQSNGGMFDDDEVQAALDLAYEYVLNGGPLEEISFSAAYTLKHGETITTPNLYGGTDYTITEAGTDGCTPSANGQTGTLGEDLTVTGTINGNESIAFTNTFAAAPTPVTIHVTGNGTTVAYTGEEQRFLTSPTFSTDNEDLARIINDVARYSGNRQGLWAVGTEVGTHYTNWNADSDFTLDAEGYDPTFVIDQQGWILIQDSTPVYEDGSLTVTKTNVGGNADDEFTFTLAMTLYTDRSTMDSSTLTRLAFMKQSSGGMFDDDEIQAAIDLLRDYIMNGGNGEPLESVSFSATFTLKGGESITAPSLFGGADYTLTETGVEGYVPSADGQTAAAGASLTVTGTIDGDETVAFVNTYGETPVYESGTLTVSKEVVNGDEDLEFNFEAALTFYNNPAARWDMSTVSYICAMMQNSGVFTNEQQQAIANQFSNAVMGSEYVAEITVTTTFTLKHGESVEFMGLPGGTDYTITEAGTAGYIPSANGQTGTAGGDLTVSGVIDGNQAVAFTNTYTDYPAFKTQALGLEGLIGVHFFVYLPEISGFEYEGVAFEIDNTDGPDTFVPFSSDMPTNANGYYQFTYYVRSIEMADTITATLKFKVDGEDRTIEKLYSVKQYFETFDDYTFLFTDLEQDMTRATADYGHYVQAFLETTRTWVIGVDYTEMDKYYTDYTADDISAAQTGLADYVTAKTTGSNMEKITYTLVLDSGTELRVYFKPAADYTGTFTFTANGAPITEDGDKISVKLQSDGRYLVAIKNIAAHELDDIYTIKAIGSDGVESSMTVSPLSYVNAIMTAYAGNEKAINAAVAIYRYAMAAAALRPSER